MVEIKELEKKTWTIRKDIIKMIAAAGSGHPGGSLSATDVMTVLYFDEMNVDPASPKKEDRDYFVLSKGHVCPALYAVLARRGYFDPAELITLRKLGSRLQGHPGINKGLPGLEASTGSLGQGLSIAGGFAMAAKLDGKPNRAYCILGDGELDEGNVWEAAMSAAHYKLSNLCAIVDNNGLQIDGALEDVMGLNPLFEKWKSFGWNVIEIDGHSVQEIKEAFAKARECKDAPSVIIAKTVKGKGVSFMENVAGWHGVAPNEEQEKAALAELDEKEKQWEAASAK
ncbi:MAG: transketolase [Elusimicrobiota bacterium]|nr:transketolase [Elusimicrobiota bacterium]